MDFIRRNNSDVVMLQEIDIKKDTFESCDYINSNYVIYSNNARSGYGTTTLVSSSLRVGGVQYDEEGRAIIIEIREYSIGNVYLPSGTDHRAKQKRDKYCAEVLPRLLIGCKPTGMIGGDWNCIIADEDASNYPEAKRSRTLQRLVRWGEWKDCYRDYAPQGKEFSRFYKVGNKRGAGRIDRAYHWGTGVVNSAAVSYTHLTLPTILLV